MEITLGELIHFFNSPPSSLHRLHNYPPPPIGSCCSTFSPQRLLRTGTRERLAPPWNASKSQVGETTHSDALKPAPDSWCPPHLCEDPLNLPGRRWGGVSPSVTPPTPDAILLNADHEPALSLSLCNCLSHRLSICTKCHSVIHSFRHCTDHQQPSWLHHWLCLHAHYN